MISEAIREYTPPQGANETKKTLTAPHGPLIEVYPGRRRMEKGFRTKLSITSLLAVAEDGKHFKHRKITEVASIVYSDLLPDDLTHEKRGKKIWNYSGAVLINQRAVIRSLEGLQANKLKPAARNAAILYLRGIRNSNPLFENISISQAINLLKLDRKAMVTDALAKPKAKKERRIKIIPVTEMEKNVVMTLTELNDQGEPVYSGIRDLNLVKKINNLPEETQLAGRSLEIRIYPMEIARKKIIKRLENLERGGQDEYVSDLLSQIRNSHPKFKELSIPNLITLLNRKGPRRVIHGIGWRLPKLIQNLNFPAPSGIATDKDPREQLMPTTFDLRFGLPNESNCLGEGTVSTSRPPKRPANVEIKIPEEIDLTQIPIPVLPKRIKTPQEYLAYSMTLIGNSRKEYMFTQPADVADQPSELQDTSKNNEYELIEALRGQSVKTILASFTKKLLAFDKREKAEEDLGSARKKSAAERFIDWVNLQPIYSGLTIPEIIDVLQRKVTCQQIVDDYIEFEELNSRAKKIKHRASSATEAAGLTMVA